MDVCVCVWFWALQQTYGQFHKATFIYLINYTIFNWNTMFACEGLVFVGHATLARIRCVFNAVSMKATKAELFIHAAPEISATIRRWIVANAIEPTDKRRPDVAYFEEFIGKVTPDSNDGYMFSKSMLNKRVLLWCVWLLFLLWRLGHFRLFEWTAQY